MSLIIKIGRKNQIVIPKSVRNKLKYKGRREVFHRYYKGRSIN